MFAKLLSNYFSYNFSACLEHFGLNLLYLFSFECCCCSLASIDPLLLYCSLNCACQFKNNIYTPFYSMFGLVCWFRVLSDLPTQWHPHLEVYEVNPEQILQELHIKTLEIYSVGGIVCRSRGRVSCLCCLLTTRAHVVYISASANVVALAAAVTGACRAIYA